MFSVAVLDMHGDYSANRVYTWYHHSGRGQEVQRPNEQRKQRVDTSYD